MAAMNSALIKKVFENMEYGNEVEDTTLALEWLKANQKIFAYIDSKNEVPRGRKVAINNVNNGQHLCDVFEPDSYTIDKILKKSSSETWEKIDSVRKCEILSRLSAAIEKSQELIIQLEIVARGILRKDTKKQGLPLLTDSLQYYSSFCFKPYKNTPLLVGIIPDHNPLSAFGYVLGPSLAAGRPIVLQTGPRLSLIATVLIELAIKEGVPEGTITLIPGKDDVNCIFEQELDLTIALFDDIYKEKYSSIECKYYHKCLHFGSSGSSMIVFDNCDLDSACHSVFDAAWAYKGMLPWSLRNIFVQENVFDGFIKKLKEKTKKIKVGNSNEKNVDLSSLDKETSKQLSNFVQSAEGVEIHQPNHKNIPIFIIGSNIVKEDLNLPIVTVVAFRTSNEAISLCNNSRHGLGVSLWTENISLINEIVEKLEFGNIWVNSHGLFSASISTSPYKTSANGFFGGKHGFIKIEKHINIPSTNLPAVSNGEMMENLINGAKISLKNWSTLNRFERMKHLQKAMQNALNNKKSKFDEKTIEIIASSMQSVFDCDFSDSFSKYTEYNVVTVHEPHGVIVTDYSLYKNFSLIIYALLEGNAMILLENDSKINACSFFCQLLPKGILSVISLSKESFETAAFHKEINCIITNYYPLGTLPLKTLSKFRTLVNSKVWKDNQIKVTLTKNIWFNKGLSFSSLQ